MIKSYSFFGTPMCPNCQEIKQWLNESGEMSLPGKIYDATEDDGMDKARELMVMSVPTMIFLDEKGEEVTRATDMDGIRKVLSNRSLSDF